MDTWGERSLASRLRTLRTNLRKQRIAFDEGRVICQLNQVAEDGWQSSAALMQQADRRRALGAARLDFYFSALAAERQSALRQLSDQVRVAALQHPEMRFELLGSGRWWDGDGWTPCSTVEQSA